MQMPEKNARLSIPDKVKAQLWVAAGGHCEFNCCNKPLDRNILTQQKVFVGQHAHIIGDSVHGPRGDAELSKKLSRDVSNLMLTCRECHWTIDSLPDDYPVDLLRRMKQRHEDRVQRLYALDETKDSVAIILRHPIKRVHLPHFTDTDVQSAILTNSDFCHAPSEHIIQLDYRSKAAREDDPHYWTELVKQMRDDFDRQLHLASTQRQPSHLSIFAFAPMPLLMQLGAIVGNKVEASTMQWNRIAESWKNPQQRELEQQAVSFDEVPPSQGLSLAVRLCLSGEVSVGAVEAVVPGLPVVRFGVPTPTPAVVESAEDVRHFRSQFTAFMAGVRNQGYRHLDVFPAMPMSLAVEFGRQLLPKVDPAIDVWDFQNSVFVKTLTLVF
jgi:hypothetical protein